MDPLRYQAPEMGVPRREPGQRWAFWHFSPEVLPRALSLAAETSLALSEADAALGRLHGLGYLVRDPRLLVGPYLTREALASSRIEGTEASLSDVLRAEAAGQPSNDDDVQEVERYVAATREGWRLLESLPISQRLVKAVHAVLLDGVRGQERAPGEFRRSPVWIGSATDTPETASYVPPPPEALPDLLADWERFVNDPPRLPLLVRAALMHYQFETIHPFLDGNGRIGRLLIGLMLMQEGRMSSPLLYLSGYLEDHRQEYYRRLQAVREQGEVQEWIQFFCTAVKRQADDAVVRAERLVAIREAYQAEAATSRARLGVLVDLIFSNPFLTVSRVEAAADLTNQGARNLIRDAEQRGWVSVLGVSGRGGKTYWVAHDVFAVVEAPNGFAEREAEGADHGT